LRRMECGEGEKGRDLSQIALTKKLATQVAFVSMLVVTVTVNACYSSWIQLAILLLCFRLSKYHAVLFLSYFVVFQVK
jgi:hypothetical protein